jgi:hypothetical protein
MKRTVFLALALFALMAVGLYAQTEADFEVDSDGKSITITGYKGSTTDVNIPAKIKNLPVTIINKSAFSSYGKLTSVTIPIGVTTIGDSAFSMNTNLKSVTIPNSVKSIESGAFSKCISLVNIIIPDSVTSIGANTFANCDSLTSVTFAGSIPASGFNANAFRGFGDIRDKYLAANGGAGTYTRPNGTATTWTKGTAAASPAAAGTPGLAFALTADSKGYIVSKGTVTKGDVVIPASYNNLPVTEIAFKAFDSVPDITSVIIPNSVTRLGQAAFSMCIHLKSVTIGSGVKEIGIQTFQNCQDLTSVTFQNTFSSNSFHDMAGFPGDLRAKYLAAGGGIGTYTRTAGGTTWTKK